MFTFKLDYFGEYEEQDFSCWIVCHHNQQGFLLPDHVPEVCPSGADTPLCCNILFERFSSQVLIFMVDIVIIDIVSTWLVLNISQYNPGVVKRQDIFVDEQVKDQYQVCLFYSQPVLCFVLWLLSFFPTVEVFALLLL